MARPARCPQCLQTMQSLRIQEVELDLCSRCGGLWFDPGELEQVAGKVPVLEPLGDLTNRLCARCDIALGVATLGTIQAESCPGCHGLFLERGALHSWAPGAPSLTPVPPPAPRPPPAPKPPPQSSQGPKTPAKRRASRLPDRFVCPDCGERKPFSQGHAHARGLVCSACTVQPQTGRDNGRSSGFGGAGDLLGWVDVVAGVIDLLVSGG